MLEDIKTVGVVGAGMMGKMIAFVFSSHYPVAVYDNSDIDLIGDIKEITLELVEKGLLSAEELELRMSRITFVSDMKSALISNADIVVEAVFEDMELKRRVFSQLESNCRDDCVFCTNTSVMSPSEISRDLQNRRRFAAAHFWNPAHLIALVEIVPCDATSDETISTLMQVFKRLNKKPILCKKDVPGFIANRLQHALWREAFYMFEEGIADAESIDDACKYGPGLRWPVLGPMENSDMVGIDLTYNIHNYLLKHLADNHEPSRLLREMLESDRLGMKSGKGWQEWTKERADAVSTGLRAYLTETVLKEQKECP